MRVETLYGATSMFYNARYVHPELPALWDRLREAIASPHRTDLPDKIYVTRRGQQLRACTNEDVVEQLFLAHGFTIVRRRRWARRAAGRLRAGAGDRGLRGVRAVQHDVQRTLRSADRAGLRALPGQERVHDLRHPRRRLPPLLLPAQTAGFHSAFHFDVERDGDAWNTC